MLLTALGLVLGGKASADLIRSGKTEARAAAVFEIADRGVRADIEAILGGELDENELIITRRLSTQGRGSSHVNGMPVTIATLERLGRRLVDIHGQFEGRALLEPDHQRALLDAYGGLADRVSEYDKARREHDQLRRQRQSLIDDAGMRQRERALLEFERDQLAAASPSPGEFDELTREANRLKSVDKIQNAVASGFAVLYESDRSAQDVLTTTARSLQPLSQAVPQLAGAAATLLRLADETREVAFLLRDVGRCSEHDPARLDQIEGRLAVYRRLAARFQCSFDDLSLRLAAIESKLEAIDHDDQALHALDEPLAAAWARLKRTADDLSAARTGIARDFARVIQKRLRPLGLGGARLTVAVDTQTLGDDGSVIRRPIRESTRSRCCLRRIPGKSLVPCARSPPGESCLDSRWPSKPCWRPSTVCRQSSSTRSMPGSAAAWARRSARHSPSWPGTTRSSA